MFARIDTSHTIDVVSVKDPAVDLGKSNVAMYKATLDLEKHLVFVEDKEPTIFVLGLISYREKCKIQDSAIKGDLVGPVDGGAATVSSLNINVNTMAMEFVRCSLRDIKNADNVEFKTVAGNPPRVCDAVMDQVSAWGILDEIGAYAMQFNEVDQATEKN